MTGLTRIVFALISLSVQKMIKLIVGLIIAVFLSYLNKSAEWVVYINKQIRTVNNMKKNADGW